MMPTPMDNNIRMMTIGFGLLVALALGIATVARVGDGETEATRTSATTTSSARPATDLPATDLPAPTAPTTTRPTTTVPTTTTTIDPVPALLDTIVESLTNRQIAEQLVVTGLAGTGAAARMDEAVGAPCIGGVFVTESNDNWIVETDREAAAAFIAAVSDHAGDEGCASLPLIMTDAELGRIVRVPAEPPGSTGEYSDRFDAGDQFNVAIDLGKGGTAYAEALRQLGIDVNFGVVADVDTSPDNFMARSGRTFGAVPGTVAALAGTFVDAHCQAGVAPALKHFPNQGATREDPHRERSFATGGTELWRETGRIPYVDTHAPMVMTGHIFMDIDTEMPASLSAAITTGLLRGDLGYTGVVITDDLSTMRGAIDVIGNAGDRAVAAIRAGADLVLFVRDTDIPTVVDALVAEMSADAAFETVARTSVRRTANLKAALGRIPGVDPAAVSLCP